MTTTAGWHDDPEGVASLRWWDGSAWTEHIWPDPSSDEAPTPGGPAGVPDAGSDAAASDAAASDAAPPAEPSLPADGDLEPITTESAATSAAPTDASDASDPPIEQPWTDLATRAPGATAKELARRARRRSFTGWLFDARTGERSLRAAAKGEREVARRLRKLEPGWLVLHSVPMGDDHSDIDHLVIGPAGIFTLNTKNLLGSRVRADPLVVEVDGKETPYLRSVAHEGEHASRLLSAACGFEVPVTPVLVVMAHRLTVLEQPADVAVVGRRSIVSWLTAQPSRQSFDAASEIFEHARRETTWR